MCCSTFMMCALTCTVGSDQVVCLPPGTRSHGLNRSQSSQAERMQHYKELDHT